MSPSADTSAALVQGDRAQAPRHAPRLFDGLPDVRHHVAGKLLLFPLPSPFQAVIQKGGHGFDADEVLLEVVMKVLADGAPLLFPCLERISRSRRRCSVTSAKPEMIQVSP